MLWGTQSRGTFRVFGLALAIALTPALMQVDEPCTPEPSQGETRLDTFHVSMAGINLIEFDPELDVYEVMLPGEPEGLIIRAVSKDPDASVSYSLSDGCETVEWGTMERGHPYSLESLPEGHSLLNVWVIAPEGKAGSYTVFFARPEACQ